MQIMTASALLHAMSHVQQFKKKKIHVAVYVWEEV